MVSPSLRWDCMHGSCSVFALGSSEVTAEVYGLYIFCPEFALTVHTYTHFFLVPYSFFVFSCSRIGVSRCKLCSTAAKGPRAQACLIHH